MTAQRRFAATAVLTAAIAVLALAQNNPSDAFYTAIRANECPWCSIER